MKAKNLHKILVCICFAVLILSCNKDEEDTTTNSNNEDADITLQIGSSYGGGVIAYIYQNGDSGYLSGQTHGIVVAPTDQAEFSEWGCFGSFIGCGSTSIGAGVENTNSIVANCSEIGIAARLCANLNSNGFSDWYLPSKNELSAIMNNRSTINTALSSIGGVSLDPSAVYWSSSESSSSKAFCYYTAFNTVESKDKDFSFMVRAIRSF
jgi:hypothetical protein